MCAEYLGTQTNFWAAKSGRGCLRQTGNKKPRPHGRGFIGTCSISETIKTYNVVAFVQLGGDACPETGAFHHNIQRSGSLAREFQTDADPARSARPVARGARAGFAYFDVGQTNAAFAFRS
jgi:hypothetical protein